MRSEKGHTTFFDGENGKFLDDYDGEHNYLNHKNEYILSANSAFGKFD